MVQDAMVLMRENTCGGQLEGVGIENLDFFGPKGHSLRSLPTRFSGPTPSNGSCNGLARINIMT